MKRLVFSVPEDIGDRIKSSDLFSVISDSGEVYDVYTPVRVNSLCDGAPVPVFTGEVVEIKRCPLWRVDKKEFGMSLNNYSGVADFIRTRRRIELMDLATDHEDWDEHELQLRYKRSIRNFNKHMPVNVIYIRKRDYSLKNVQDQSVGSGVEPVKNVEFKP